MVVAVTGATGLVGQHLLDALAAAGIQARRLVRTTPSGPDEVLWDPATGADPAALEGVDAVIHLAGESVNGRWTPAKKDAIRRSRVEGTRNLAKTLAAMEHPPRVLVTASACGIYGDRGEEPLTEVSLPGDDFLATVCQEWEAASRPAQDAGIRVVHIRSGVVLDAHGGALAQMLPFFRAGLGGRLGHGKQWMPWITGHDLARVILHAIDHDLQGPINAAADSVPNKELTKALATVLGRPALVPVPATAARIVFGEVANAMLLASQRVVPARLRDDGFEFHDADLEEALRGLLGVEVVRRASP